MNARATPQQAGRSAIARTAILSAISLLAICGLAAPAKAAQPKLHSAAGLKVYSQQRLSKRLLTTSVGTSALPGPANVRILLPRGYSAHPKRRYPVLYLLHGTSGGANDWTDAGDAAKTTARRRLIVVMPDIALNRDGGGWCSNWPDGSYRWESFHVAQLIPWIDRNLPTVRNRDGRAIAGLSQGGFCSMSYAARHPGLFSTALSYSGAPDIAYSPDAVAGSTAIINATEVGLDGVPANSIFGDRVTNEINWAAHDPSTLAENLRATRLYLYTGNGLPGGPFDPPVPNSGGAAIEALVHQDTIDFHNHLDDLGIASHFDDYGPGTHSFAYWARDLRWSIGKVMHDFHHPPAKPKAATFTSADGSYRVYGWRVHMHREAREFSTLEHARCRKFGLSGSGSASVRTPRCLRPHRRYRVKLAGEGVHRKLKARTGSKGRLKIKVPLGPPNPYQQYTAEAGVAGTAAFSTRVKIKRLHRRR